MEVCERKCVCVRERTCVCVCLRESVCVLSWCTRGVRDLSSLSLSRCLRVISRPHQQGTPDSSLSSVPPSLHPSVTPHARPPPRSLPCGGSNDFLNLFSGLLRPLSECLNAYANQPGLVRGFGREGRGGLFRPQTIMDGKSVLIWRRDELDCVTERKGQVGKVNMRCRFNGETLHRL